MDIDAFDLAIGLVVLAGGVYLWISRDEQAAWIYRYYQSIPQRNFRPRWFWRVYRPSESQSRLLAIAFAVAATVFGLAAIASGLRLI